MSNPSTNLCCCRARWLRSAFLPPSLPIIVVTNQSVIGRGIVTRTAVDAIHAHLCSVVHAAGGRIDAIYLCPHHPGDRCNCRKPNPQVCWLPPPPIFSWTWQAFASLSVTASPISQQRAQLAVIRCCCAPGDKREKLARLLPMEPAVVLMDDLPSRQLAC